MSARLKIMEISAALLALMGAAGCDFYREKSAPEGLSSDPASDVPGYTTLRAQIFQPSCLSCHGGQTSPDLSTYASARAVAATIKDVTITRKTMPLGGAPLSQAQLQLIEEWVDGGAPENDVQIENPHPAPSSQPSPLPPSPDQVIAEIRQDFDSRVQPLVQRGCMECHDSHAEPEGILGHLPIIREIEWDHIHKASAVLDFSETFPDWSTQVSDPAFFLRAIKKAIEESSMPPSDFKQLHETDGKLLTFAEELTIVDWVDKSTELWALANPAPPTPSQFFYSRCLGCHNSTTPSGGFIFQKNGDQVVVPNGKSSSGIPYLTPFDPENSAVYLVLLTDPSVRKGLPQMPDGDSATDTERALILNWIKQGIPSPQ